MNDLNNLNKALTTALNARNFRDFETIEGQKVTLDLYQIESIADNYDEKDQLLVCLKSGMKYTLNKNDENIKTLFNYVNNVFS